MRILMYTPIFPPAIGGPSTQCFNLCKVLVMRGIQPVVVTYGGKAFAKRTESGFAVYDFRTVYTSTPLDKAIRWIVFPFFIARVMRREQIDILHCHCVSMLSFIAAMVARMRGIPAIVKFAGDWVWETLSTYRLQAKDFDEIYRKHGIARFMTWVEKKGLGLFDRIWVVSEFRRNNIRTLLGTDEKVVVINNCLYLAGGGARSWKPGDPVVIITASRQIPHKRVPLMIDLFSRMNVPNARLVLVGRGIPDEEHRIDEAIEKSGLRDRIEKKGVLSTEDLYDAFWHASFYVSTSIEEGFPNVFIEAMHFGLPVITADAGGCRELVTDNDAGYVIDCYDEQKFIDKMRLLATDIEVRNRMSRQAFERSKLFNLEHKIESFIEMYESVLSARKS